MSTQVISVSLPSEIIYVSGTVNSKAYTWTLIDNEWQAIVDRAADEKYTVALTAVNSAGSSSSFNLLLYYGIVNLITDRTAEDVQRIDMLVNKGWENFTDSEKLEWLDNMKGAYNASDLNRVGCATTYLANRLVQLSQDMSNYLAALNIATDSFFATPYDPDNYHFTGKSNWVISDIPTENQMTEYLEKIKLLRSSFDYVTDELPANMHRLTYNEANAIEKALMLLDSVITEWGINKKQWADKTAQAWFHSGDLFSAEI